MQFPSTRQITTQLRRLAIGCGAAFLLTVGAPQSEEALTIRALTYEVIRTNEGTLLLNLSGAVVMEYQGRTLEGEQFAVDAQQQRVRANAPFRFFAPEGVLQGERIDYFYALQRGRFEGVQAEVLGVYVRAAVLEGDLGDFSAREATVSTCDPFRPPIRVQAGRIRLRQGARLTVSNARLVLYGRQVLSLPQFTLRLRETAEIVSMPSPVYARETGWGLRMQVELPIGDRLVMQGGIVSYLHAVPELRLIGGAALSEGEPSLGDPDLRLRFEQSPLYNLRARPERTQTRPAPTVRVEYSSDIRPLFAPRERLRVSRRELGLIVPTRARTGTGEVSLRYGSLSERIDGQHTPTRERLSLEGEWLQPLWTNQSVQLQLRLWSSLTRYQGIADTYQWLRPQLEIVWQPREQLTLMAGYAQTSTRHTSPFLSEQIRARREASFRAEYQQGNARVGALLKFDLDGRELYDVQLLVGWRDRCIEPFVFWRRNPSAVLFGLSLTTARQ